MHRYLLLLVFISSVLTTTQGEDGSLVRTKRTTKAWKSNFRKQCLEAHNNFRRLHNAQPLISDPMLNEYAQNYAYKLAKADRNEAPFSGGEMGENTYWNNRRIDGVAPVDKWYSDSQYYNYNMANPPNYQSVRSFTQMVWAYTRLLGTGVARSKSGRYYVVCSYLPRGNIINMYSMNVFRPN